MSIKFQSVLATIVAVLLFAAPASAVVLFQDNFNSPTSAGNWTKNAAPAANAAAQTADFAFNYGDFGIPAAPGSGDTTGLRLRANVPADTSRPAGVLSGLSMSPTGQNFGTNYKMTVYAWSNFFGAPNATGLGDNGNSEGGTANIMFAVGTSGTVPVVVGNTGAASGANIDAIGFATTGDGGITNDYRVYPKSGTIVPGTTAGVYAAGNDATALQNTNTFYATKFLAQTAPAVQQDLANAEFAGDAAPVMAGSTQAGSFGFAWHKVVITKSAGTVTWDVDDNRFATYNASALTLGGNNIALGVSDVNTTTARHPSLVFTLFDNLVVEDVAAPGVNADYNGNGVVDAADYVVWRNAGPTDTLPNDPTAGTVDASDYDLWRSRFGLNSGSGSGGAVPEPGTAVLLLVGALAIAASRRR